jgi:hypothetical protein
VKHFGDFSDAVSHKPFKLFDNYGKKKSVLNMNSQQLAIK